VPYTHLPSQDAKRVRITGRRSSSICQPEALRDNQFWSSAVEKPIDICPWRGGYDGSRSKTSNTGTPTSVDEDVSLDEHERMIKTWAEENPYDLKVPVNYSEAVHVLHGVRHSQQLMSRYSANG